MGLLDVVNVCTSCKKVLVQMAGGKCPDCGGDTISLLHTPKSWNALADEQKRAVIEKAFQKVQKTQDPTASPEDECPITTTDSFENGEIEKYLDTVSGTDIHLVGGVLGVVWQIRKSCLVQRSLPPKPGCWKKHICAAEMP